MWAVRSVLATAAIVYGADAASMNVHSLVSYRAQQYYSGAPNVTGVEPALRAALQNAISAQPESVAAGSDFPDFLYACGNYADHHDAGEVAHWPTFHTPAVRYARRLADFNQTRDGNSNSTTPYDWSNDTQKLIAFIYGLTVHYVTDEVWEGLAADLGDGHGFVELVNGLNRAAGGSGDQDEGTTNMAGDYYAAWSMNETGLHPWKREFPLEHIVEIYHQTPETNALEPFNNNQIKEVPVVAERLLDMPFSGIDGMATWTSFEWARLTKWFQIGPPDPAPPRKSQPATPAAAPELAVNGIVSGDDKSVQDVAADGDDRRTAAFFRELRPFAGAAATLSKMPKDTLRQMFTAVPTSIVSKGATPDGGKSASKFVRSFLYHGPPELQADLTGILRAVMIRHCGEKIVLNVTAAASADGSRATENKNPAKESKSVRATTTTADKKPNINTSNVFADPTVLSMGTAPVQYHGHAMAVGDFDKDGHPDVVVGAYGAGVQAYLPQAGLVNVLYNASLAALHAPGSLNEQQWSIVRAPQQQPVAQFGRALAVLDFNLDGVDDLAVSAPGASDWDLSSEASNPFPSNSTPASFRMWGKVYVLLGKAGEGLSAVRAVTLESANDWTTLGEVSLAADINNDGHLDLLLGCPSASSGSTGATHGGRVLGILASTGHVASSVGVDVEMVAALQLSGRSKFEMFGQSMAVVSNGSILLVGAPFGRINNVTTGQPTIATGRVYGYTLAATPTAATVAGRNGNNAGKAKVDAVTATPSFEIAAPLPGLLGEFGRAIASSPSTVAISSPTAGVAGYTPDGDARHGTVFVIGSEVLKLLKGNVSLATVPWSVQLNGAAAFARFGYSLDFADVNNDGLADLIAGAPMETIDGAKFSERELGGVYVWGGASIPTGGNHSTASASWQGRGTHPRGRFGSAFAAIPGVGLAVSAPRAPAPGNGDEMVGVVELYAATDF